MPHDADDHQHDDTAAHVSADTDAGRRARRTRTRVLLLLVVLAGCTYCLYMYRRLTDPDRIASVACSVLSKLTGMEVHIAGARFHPISGVVIDNISFTLDDAAAASSAFTPDDLKLLSARRVGLKPRLGPLLRGELVVARLVIIEPHINVVHDLHTDTWNWEPLFTGPGSGKLAGFSAGQRPHVYIDNARLATAEIVADGRAEDQVSLVSARAIPANDREGHYQISVQFTRGENGGPRMHLEFDPRTAEVVDGRIFGVDLEQLHAMMPGTYRRMVSGFLPSGTVTVSEIRHVPDQRTRVVVEIEHASCVVPVDYIRRGMPAVMPGTVVDHCEIYPSWLRPAHMQGRLIYEATTTTTDPNHSSSSTVGGNKVRHSTVTLEHLEGTLSDGQFSASACVRDPLGGLRRSSLDMQVDLQQVRLPDPDDEYQHAALESLPVRMQQILELYRLKGLVDASLSLSRAAGEQSRPEVSGTVELLGIQGRHPAFPYMFEHIEGTVRLVDGRVEMPDLLCRSGSTQLHACVLASDTSATPAAVVAVRADNCPLDDKLYDALPSSARANWDTFDPSGYADLRVWFERGKGRGASFCTWIDARLHDTSAVYRRFPYRLTDINGRVLIDPFGTRFDQVRARHNDARIVLDGWGTHFSQDVPEIDMSITANDVPVDEDLMQAVPARFREPITSFGLGGSVSVDMRVQTDSADEAVRYNGRITLDDVHCAGTATGFIADSVTGAVDLSDGQARFDGVQVRQGSTLLDINGELALSADSPVRQVRITGKDVPIDSPLAGVLPEAYRLLLDDLALQGTVDGEVVLDTTANGIDDWQVHLTTTDGSICWKHFPYALENMSGTVRITPKGTQIDLGQASRADTMIRAGGTVRKRGDMTYIDWSGRITGLHMDDYLHKAMPAALAATFARLEMSGLADVTIDNLTVELGPDRSIQHWSAVGSVQMTGMSGHLGLPIRDLGGMLRGRIGGGGDPADLVVDGRFDCDTIRIADRKIEHLQGTVTKSADSRRVDIENISGSIYGGTVSGTVQGKWLEKGWDYGLELIVEDAYLGPMLYAASRDNQQVRDPGGRLRTRVRISGKGGEQTQLRARGRFEISQADLVQVPLISQILGALTDPLPTSSKQDAGGRFVIQDDVMHLGRCWFDGKGLSLIGKGTMQMPTKRLDVLLLAGPRSYRETDIPLLSELVRGTAREVVELRLQGTLDDPQVKTTPLRSLDAALRFLFAGDTDQPDTPSRFSEDMDE